MIFTRKRCVKHQFTCQNTQQSAYLCQDRYSCFLLIKSLKTCCLTLVIFQSQSQKGLQSSTSVIHGTNFKNKSKAISILLAKCLSRQHSNGGPYKTTQTAAL